jgi:hypothetical protein
VKFKYFNFPSRIQVQKGKGRPKFSSVLGIASRNEVEALEMYQGIILLKYRGGTMVTIGDSMVIIQFLFYLSPFQKFNLPHITKQVIDLALHFVYFSCFHALRTLKDSCFSIQSWLQDK